MDDSDIHVFYSTDNFNYNLTIAPVSKGVYKNDIW